MFCCSADAEWARFAVWSLLVKPPLHSANTPVVLMEVSKYINCSENDLVWN